MNKSVGKKTFSKAHVQEVQTTSSEMCVDQPSLIVSLLLLSFIPKLIYYFFPLFALSFCLYSSVLKPTAACCFLYFFLINNIIPIFRPLVASPSVTCVRLEESNY